MCRNKSIQISGILILSLFLSSFNMIDGIHSAGSDENAAPVMPVTNTPTETTIPTYTEIPTETATQTFTEEPTATETPSISATPTFTETLPVTDTPTLTPTQIQTITETPTVAPTATETSAQTCMGSGIYDGSDSNITYSTGWTSQTLSGAYNNTEHYSETIDSTVTFCVVLNEPSTISIIYRSHYNFGMMDISIDGNGVAYDSNIDQYALSPALLQRWDSQSLNPGNYVVTLTHISGRFVTLDAIIVNHPVGDGTYDDMDTNIFYSDGWSSYTNYTGNYNDTEHYSTISNSRASLTFKLDQPGIVSIIYRKESQLGQMSVSIDNGYAYTFNQYAPSWVTQNQWDSALLDSGVHTLTLSGYSASLDAIIVNSSPVLNNYHDDTSYEFTYSSDGWTPQDMPGAYANTEYNSSLINSTASFTHNFTQQGTFSVLFRAHPQFGIMNVLVDDISIGSFTQQATSIGLMRSWDSDPIEAGVHTITLVHHSGSFVSLDAIVINYPVGDGTYDDMDTNIFYSDGWSSQTNITNNYDDTEHYSSIFNSTAGLTFKLDQPGIVSIIYRKESQLGQMSVSIDNGYAYTFNQYAPIWISQNQWDSALLSAGIHTLKLTHVNGTYVILDAIIVNSSPVLNNYHDDASYEFTYSSDGWTPQDMPGAYANTEYNSSLINSTASFTHNFTQQGTFSVLFRAHPQFGIMNVLVDDISIGSFNQQASSIGLMQSWDSDPIEAGVHTITLVHHSGSFVSLDAIVIN